MKKNHRELVKALGRVSQLGITMVTPVVLCVAVGIWMDHKFSIHTTLIWLILGVLAGARSAYLMAKKSVTPGEEETLEQELREKDKKKKGEKQDV